MPPLAALDLKEAILRLKKETQRRHPRPQLPDRRDPGPRRLRRRLARPRLQGQGNRRRRDRLLRRPLHGRDRQDRQPDQDRRPPRHGRRLLARGILPRPRARGLPQGERRTRTTTSSPTSTARAHVKALCDVICTSGNAVRIVEQAPADRPILFVPDDNLGAWVMEQTGRKMDLWQGSCYVHVEFTRDSINRIKDRIPRRPRRRPPRVHPGRPPARRRGLLDRENGRLLPGTRRSKNIIVVTESGMLHRLRKEVPRQEPHRRPHRPLRLRRLPLHEDEHPRKTPRLPRQPRAPQVELPEDIRARAEAPLLRMLEQSR